MCARKCLHPLCFCRRRLATHGLVECQVAELRAAKEKALARGKPEPPKDAERLDRNDKKLEESKLECVAHFSQQVYGDRG